MHLRSAAASPAKDEFLFLPLGGGGEIGMNCTLYGHDGSWLVVDLGITFGGDEFPEYPVLMADPDFIVRQRERVAGIVLTHGHEDHIGALPYVYQRLRCPLYATPFTAALVRQKLSRAGVDDPPLVEVVPGQRIDVGPFRVEYIAMTHSIPEPNALLLETPLGAVLHTGDWKLDDRPVVGVQYDRTRLRLLRGKPLLAMVCDSTNAVVAGGSGSEGSLFAPLRGLSASAVGRVLVTCFASNVARLVTLARVANEVGRRFGVLGAAMERMIAVARRSGYWPQDLPPLVKPRHLGFLPRQEVLAACTGTQGERYSALARLAEDRHRDLLLDRGDTVIFSSRLIPGNERSVERVQRRLQARGVAIVTDSDADVHVSGHPAEEDLRTLYHWVQPPAVIPVHGTPRHLAANASIAAACHVPHVRVVRNGDLCRLGFQGIELLRRIDVGRLALEEDGQLRGVAAPVLVKMRERSR